MNAVARAPTLSRQELRDLVADNYPAIALGLLKPLLHLLSLSRQVCGGDMDKFLILLVVAVRTTEHSDFAAFTPEQLSSGEIPVFPSLGTNIRSVADSIGAPKETVRRKVAELVETGWITRQDNDLHFTVTGYREVASIREAVEALAVRNFETLAAMLRGKAD